MNTEQQRKSKEFIQKLTQKAWESEDFKNRLINNPVAALEEISGKDLSGLKSKKIVVSDQTNKETIYINIPAKPNINELELTEEQLEQVAGGFTPAFYVVGAGIGIGVTYLVDEYIAN